MLGRLRALCSMPKLCSIPESGQTEDFKKLAFTAFLLDVQHYKRYFGEKAGKFASYVLGKDTEIPPALSGRHAAGHNQSNKNHAVNRRSGPSKPKQRACRDNVE